MNEWHARLKMRLLEPASVAERVTHIAAAAAAALAALPAEPAEVASLTQSMNPSVMREADICCVRVWPRISGRFWYAGSAHLRYVKSEASAIRRYGLATTNRTVIIQS